MRTSALLLAFLFGISQFLPLSCTLDNSIQQTKAAKRNLQHMNDLILRGEVGEGEFHIPTEQEKLDTIKSALSKLPTEELNRLGIDLHQEFLVGTQNGDLLKNVWNMRQAEVKKAVDGLMKPAEFMRDIINFLQNSTDDEKFMIQNLVVLESLLADVDNARDFHTIGGWPVLLNLLNLNNSIDIRSSASWCIGTAVKNDYDYQLWIFEEVDRLTDTVSGLTLFLENLDFVVSSLTKEEEEKDNRNQKVYDLTKRLLYALSSCLRGNMDVQERLLTSSTTSNFPTLLYTLSNHIFQRQSLAGLQVSSNQNHFTILRKIWSLVSDMMDELAYIKEGLISEMILSRGITEGESEGESLEDQIKIATQHLHPLGEVFLMKSLEDSHWLHLSQSILRELTKGCLLTNTNQEEREQVEVSIKENVPVLSPTPSSSSSSSSSSPIKFNEDCPLFVSSSLRGVYQSVLNTFRLTRKYSSSSSSSSNLSIEDMELISCLDSIATHPTMLE